MMFGFLRKKETPSGARRLSVAVASDGGPVRTDNQDAYFINRLERVFCVADGMGGGAEGARASAEVCASLKAALPGCPSGGDRRRRAVEAALSDASARIFGYASSRGYSQMGSTVVVMLFDAALASADVCHVGDSRVYRIRRGMSQLLTRDHTVGVEMGAMIDRRRIGEFRDRDNPLSHILTRAVGTETTVTPEWRTVDVEPGDRFVICSDGVHDVVSDARLAALVAAGPLESALTRLQTEIVRRGAPDNYTFILAEVLA
jgi:protein phosphatase